MSKEEFDWALGVIKDNEKHGIVTIQSMDGLLSCPLSKLIEQPAEGLLYDLNRNKLTTITLGEKGMERWINDYAVAMVIEYLMKEIERLKNEKL
jgi:hypothetical protein